MAEYGEKSQVETLIGELESSVARLGRADHRSSVLEDKIFRIRDAIQRNDINLNQIIDDARSVLANINNPE